MVLRSSEPDAWDEVVGDLYDAVLEKETTHFQGALRRFEKTIDSDGCHFFGMNSLGQEVFTVCTHPFDISGETEAYYKHFRHIDPRFERAQRFIGEAWRATDHFSASFINKNEFFQDFLIPLGRQFTAGGMLAKSNDWNSTIVFNRFKGRQDFSDEELDTLRRYFPHLKRVVRLALNDRLSTLLHGAQADLLQQQSVGVIGLNKQQQVLFINQAAQRFLGTVPNLGLHGSVVQDTSPLAHACRQAHQSRKPSPIRLATPEGELVVTAWATPKRSTTTWLPSVSAASDQPLHTCVMVQLLRPGHRLTPSLLMQLYGFTAAEARLAKELVQGTTVEAYAQSFHISVATVRTQLRQVLAKSGHARQQELIAHLASLQVL
jgi:DNA-binding CsgD family transcriptional regulator/PAS domain-containing protein